MKALILAAVIAATPLAAHQAQAAPAVCKPRAEILEILSRQFGEARQGFGVQSDQRVLELYANVETGTWSALVTLPTGRSCVVASGEDWVSVEQQPAGEDV